MNSLVAFVTSVWYGKVKEILYYITSHFNLDEISLVALVTSVMCLVFLDIYVRCLALRHIHVS